MPPFLATPELQGVAAIIATVEFSWLVWDKVKRSGVAPARAEATPLSQRSGLATHVTGVAASLLVAWLIYVLPLLLLALTGGTLQDAVAVSPWVFIFSSLPILASVVILPRTIGAFLGGGLPFALFFLQLAISTNAFAPGISPMTWFVFCLLLGGVYGVFAAVLTTNAMRSLGLPLPLERRCRGRHVAQRGTDRLICRVGAGVVRSE